MKQLIGLFQNLTSFLRLFFTTTTFQLYGKQRIKPWKIDIFVLKNYNIREMKPFSVYEMFQDMKQR